jgi:LysM repeat protein
MPDFGIDISVYQKGINLEKAKQEGIKFIILRAGFTGYGNGVSKNKDSQFEYFYKECKRLNIPVGAYWYSCATSYEKGKDEAEYLYEHCLKGKQFEYPIYIDVEDSHWQIKAGKQQVTNAILGFCEYLKNHKYISGVYANSNWFRNYIDYKKLERFEIWIASWGKSKPNFINANLWQFGGSTNLIRTNKIAGKIVDQDYSFKDFPSYVKSNGLNGYSGNNTKSILEIAYEVIEGKYGNGIERKNNLEKLGYNYAEVQTKVNELLGYSNGNSNNIHIVVKGDNLSKIAKKYKTTIRILINLNKDKYPSLEKNPNYLKIGWILKIK